jgi:hypothetical protein
VGIFWAIGRQVPRTRYRRWLWQPHDTLMTAVGVLATLAILAVWLGDRMALIYYPYPPFDLRPDVQPWLTILFGVPALPALLTARPRRLGVPGSDRHFLKCRSLPSDTCDDHV